MLKSEKRGSKGHRFSPTTERMLAKKRIVRPLSNWRKVNISLDPTPKRWWEENDVVVSFSYPMISDRLERLMGTTVVRLTDRNYMKSLAERIEADFKLELDRRISRRQNIELERQRLLVLQGKEQDIPKELIKDPILDARQRAALIIARHRRGMKTDHERHTAAMRAKAAKWELIRAQHEQEERKLLERQFLHRRQMRLLQLHYMNEDAENGMNLLRIHDEKWRPCEMDLKQFLQNEREAFLARSRMQPKPYRSDPKDLENLKLRRREQKRLEREQKLQKRLLLEKANADKSWWPRYDMPIPSQLSMHSSSAIFTPPDNRFSQPPGNEHDQDSNEEEKNYDSDAETSSEEEEVPTVESTIEESNKKYEQLLEEETKENQHKGFLITEQQYNQLRYKTDELNMLANTSCFAEMYLLVEEIIIGERVEILPEEEGEEEEQPTVSHEVESSDSVDLNEKN